MIASHINPTDPAWLYVAIGIIDAWRSMVAIRAALDLAIHLAPLADFPFVAVAFKVNGNCFPKLFIHLSTSIP
jgi:hypothetical protein